MNKKKKREKPVKLLTLDTETRGFFGAVFRAGLFDGESFHAANSFKEIKHIILKYSIDYDVHVYIHNLDFDLSKIAEEVAAGVDFDQSIFINNNVAVFSTDLQITQQQTPEPTIRPAPVVFHDSAKLLQGSLDQLSKDFGLPEDERKIDLSEHIKARGWAQYDEQGHFDKHASLGYYFQHVEPDEPQLNIYLEADCVALYRILEKAIDLSQLDEEEFVRCPTAASLAMKVYKEVWGADYDEAVKSNFRGKLGEFVEESIRDAYYGGRTEVFKPELVSGYHYDVNSLYPYVMRDNEFPVGWYDHYTGREAQKMLGFWLTMQRGGGFAELDIYVPETLHIPPLPKKHEGKLLFPVGKLTGTWAFPEIATAIRAGCKIEHVHQVWFFEKMAPIFRDFVTYWEHIKKTSSGAKRKFAKLIQNALYGKFGMARVRRSLVPIDKLAEYEEKGELYIKRYHPVLKREFLEVETKAHAPYIQPQIAAYVTALARCKLYEALTDETGGEKYYCDTDSIVQKLEMAAEAVDPDDYGKWDLENRIQRGVYLQPKLYFEKTADGEEVKKAKGIPKDQMKHFTESRYYQILDEIRGGADRVELYENVRKNKKFVTKLKNGEEFDATDIVKKGINLRAMQKRKMDYINNRTCPHKIYEWGPEKDQYDLWDWERRRRAYETQLEQAYAYDEIKEAVRQHGYIKTVRPGERDYGEYNEISQSARVKYFRVDGLPVDVFADAAGMEVSEIWAKCRG